MDEMKISNKLKTMPYDIIRYTIKFVPLDKCRYCNTTIIYYKNNNYVKMCNKLICIVKHSALLSSQIFINNIRMPTIYVLYSFALFVYIIYLLTLIVYIIMYGLLYLFFSVIAVYGFNINMPQFNYVISIIISRIPQPQLPHIENTETPTIEQILLL
jgi:hypothetical protein